MTIFTNDLIDKISKFSFRYSIEIYDIIGTSDEKEVTKYLTKDKDRWVKELQSIIDKNGGSISSIESQFKRSVKLHCKSNDLSLKSGRFSPVMARHFINAAWKCYGENHSDGGLNRGGPLGTSNPERYNFNSMCDYLEKEVFFISNKVKVKTKEKSNQTSSGEKETRELLLRRFKDKNEENQKNIKIIEEKTKQNNELIKRISDLEKVIDFNKKEESNQKEVELESVSKEKEDKVTIENKFEYEDNSKHFTLFGGDFEFFDLRKTGFLFILICVLLFLIVYNDYEINNILKLVLSIIKE
jgi:hypothetical protein